MISAFAHKFCVLAWARPLATFLLVMALAGCAAAPRGTQPLDVAVELDLPDSFREAGVESGAIDSSVQPGSAADTPWWNSFNDEVLDKLVAEALTRNHNLVAAVARVDAAVAEARVAGAELWPTLGVSGTGGRSQRNFVGFPDFSAAGAGTDPDPGSDAGSSDQVLSVTTGNYGVSLDLSWELDLWGRVRSSDYAATADAAAAIEDLEAVRLSIAAQTAKAYFAVIGANQHLKVAQTNLRNFQATRSKVLSRYEHGLGPLSDLQSATATTANSEAELLRRQRLQAAAARQLELLLGRYPTAELQPIDTFPGLAGAVPAGLPMELLARRPDLVASARRLEAAGYRAAQRQAELLPRLSLTASTGRNSNELSDLLDGSFGIWSLAGNLVQPVFQGGRLRAQVDAADARVSTEAANYANLVLTAAGEVETALLGEESFEATELALAKAAQHSRSAADLVEQRYASGLAPYLSVLDTQRTALVAESRLVEAQQNRLENRVDLFLALGGSFSGGPGDEM